MEVEYTPCPRSLCRPLWTHLPQSLLNKEDGKVELFYGLFRWWNLEASCAIPLYVASLYTRVHSGPREQMGFWRLCLWLVCCHYSQWACFFAEIKDVPELQHPKDAIQKLVAFDTHCSEFFLP